MKTKNKTHKICIVIPAHNEDAVIKDVLQNTTNSFMSTPYSIEIVVVNDASRDTTSEIAKKSGATVIDHLINTGAGGATTTGLKYAIKKDFDIVATMDADGQHDPLDVIKGIDEIIKRQDDLVIGSRLLQNNDMSTLKKIGNKGLSLITFILFGINSTDSQSGLRIYSNNALNQLEWKTSGYEFCSEMLWRAKQKKLKVSEYPIKTIYTNYSKSKGQSNWNGVNILKSLVRHRIMEIFE